MTLINNFNTIQEMKEFVTYLGELQIKEIKEDTIVKKYTKE